MNLCHSEGVREPVGSALGHPDPLVEIEAAVVSTMGDEQHLAAAAVGEDDEIPCLGRALQQDLVLGSRQLVDLFPERKGV